MPTTFIVPRELFRANGALTIDCVGTAYVRNPMSVDWHFLTCFVECVQDDLAIHDIPSLHRLISNVRLMLCIVEARLLRWNFHARRRKMETLVQGRLQLLILTGTQTVLPIEVVG